MKKIKIFCGWDLDVDFYSDINTELYINFFPTSPKPADVMRFVVIFEPPEIHNLTNEAYMTYNNGYFDYLLTHQQDLIDNIPNAYLFEFGTCWIKNYICRDKQFSVSTLVGGKMMAEGHIIRHQVLSSQDKIKNILTRFFNSSHIPNGISNQDDKLIIASDKSPLFDSQYHICIENTKRDNWFTEKLIDCLQTKTVPIYYGCPNIEKWFDTRGMIIVDNINDIITKCNNLSPYLYNSMLPFIEYNFEKSKEFVDIADRIKKTISNIISKKI
jgi:hypothetical protein